MSTIRFNPAGLQGASRNLKANGSDLENIILMMDRIVNGLESDWEGEAARAYAEQYHTLKPNLLQARHLIEEMAIQIDQALQSAQELDATTASKFRA